MSADEQSVDVILVDVEEWAALTRLAGGVMSVLPRLPDDVRGGLQLLVDAYLKTNASRREE